MSKNTEYPLETLNVMICVQSDVVMNNDIGKKTWRLTAICLITPTPLKLAVSVPFEYAECSLRTQHVFEGNTGTVCSVREQLGKSVVPPSLTYTDLLTPAFLHPTYVERSMLNTSIVMKIALFTCTDVQQIAMHCAP